MEFPPLRVGQRWIWKSNQYFIGEIVKVHSAYKADIIVLQDFRDSDKGRLFPNWDWAEAVNRRAWTFLKGQEKVCDSGLSH